MTKRRKDRAEIRSAKLIKPQYVTTGFACVLGRFPTSSIGPYSGKFICHSQMGWLWSREDVD